jgi:VWFA-related protein
MKHVAVLPVILSLFALIPSAGAQQTYIETFEVRLHNLDIVVTDKSGAPVTGLSKEDFVVLEDGVPQAITNFSIYDSASGSAATAERPAEQAPVVEPPPPRRIVFFIDEIRMQKIARDRLFRSVQQILRTMRPEDVAAVLTPVGTNVLQEFTSDQVVLEAALKKAIDASTLEAMTQQYRDMHRVMWELESAYNKSGAFSRSLQLHLAIRTYVEASRRRVAHRLGQIRATVAAMAGQEGRKVLVLITEGLSAIPGAEVYGFEEEMKSPSAIDSTDRLNSAIGSGTDFSKDIDDLARMAAARGVTIYALEPEVPIRLALRGDVSADPKEDKYQSYTSEETRPRYFLDDLLHNSALTLTSLTEKTGGRWFRGIDEIDDTFHQVTSDLRAYYSLAYRARGEADKPRRVSVTVRNRPNLTVRTRTDVLDTSTGKEMEDLVAAGLLYPRRVNELTLTVKSNPLLKNLGLFTVPLEISMPLEKLTFLPTPAGRYRAAFSVHFAASGEHWDFASGGDRDQEVLISEAQYVNRSTITYRYRTSILVAPGRVRVAIGVLDQTSKLTGFGTVDVDSATVRQ